MRRILKVPQPHVVRSCRSATSYGSHFLGLAVQTGSLELGRMLKRRCVHLTIDMRWSASSGTSDRSRVTETQPQKSIGCAEIFRYASQLSHGVLCFLLSMFNL